MVRVDVERMWRNACRVVASVQERGEAEGMPLHSIARGLYITWPETRRDL
jgi:hypothetical protein